MIYNEIDNPNSDIIVRYYDSDVLCSIIHVNRDNESVQVLNYDVPLWKTAFGKNTLPSYRDFRTFLESRCIPRSRAGLKRYLTEIGVSEYNPITILQKTHGRMAEDNQWLEMEFL